MSKNSQRSRWLRSNARDSNREGATTNLSAADEPRNQPRNPDIIWERAVVLASNHTRGVQAGRNRLVLPTRNQPVVHSVRAAVRAGKTRVHEKRRTGCSNVGSTVAVAVSPAAGAQAAQADRRCQPSENAQVKRRPGKTSAQPVYHV